MSTANETETKIDFKFKYLNSEEYLKAENKDEYIKAKMTDFLAKADYPAMTGIGVEIEKLNKFISKIKGNAEEEQRLKDEANWEIENPPKPTKDELLENILKLCGNSKDKKLTQIKAMVGEIKEWVEPPKNPFAKKTAGGGAPRGKMAKNSEKQQAKYGRTEEEKCKAVVKKKGIWTRCIWKTGGVKHMCSRHCKIQKEGGEITTIDEVEGWVEDERLKL